MFEGAIFNPHTVAAVFQQASLSQALHDGYVAAVFNPLSETAVNATPLILTGLSVGLAFRAGLFNIGAAGQWIGGAIVATWLGFGVSLPPVIHVIVCLLGAFAGGAVIGWIVGELKARTGAHEVVVTIMLNYVMYYFLAYILGTKSMQQPGRTDLISPVIAGSARLWHIAGPSLRINAGFLLALLAAAGVWWLLNRSTIGFEFRTVGANPSAARTAGMSVERAWVLAMLLAGGLAGLAASTVVQGTDYQLNFLSYGTYGFDGITVALLGRARPVGIVLSALLFGALHAGGVQMQASTQIPLDIVTVIQSLIVLVRGGAAADPGHVPAAGDPRRRDGRDRGEGVERMTSLTTAVRSSVTVNRTAIASATYVLFGLADILLFGLHSHGSATFSFQLYGAKVGVPNLVLPAGPGGVRARRGVHRHRRGARGDTADPGRAAGLHRHRGQLLRDRPAVLGGRGELHRAERDQPAAGHRGLLHPAHPRRAGRRHVRAVRRDQHRHRGAAAARRVRRRRDHQRVQLAVAGAAHRVAGRRAARRGAGRVRHPVPGRPDHPRRGARTCWPPA